MSELYYSVSVHGHFVYLCTGGISRQSTTTQWYSNRMGLLIAITAATAGLAFIYDGLQVCTSSCLCSSATRKFKDSFRNFNQLSVVNFRSKLINSSGAELFNLNEHSVIWSGVSLSRHKMTAIFIFV